MTPSACFGCPVCGKAICICCSPRHVPFYSSADSLINISALPCLDVNQGSTVLQRELTMPHMHVEDMRHLRQKTHTSPRLSMGKFCTYNLKTLVSILHVYWQAIGVSVYSVILVEYPSPGHYAIQSHWAKVYITYYLQKPHPSNCFCSMLCVPAWT